MVQSNDLTGCQRTAMERLATRDNLFITGHAGTGKTFLISQFLRTKEDRAEFPVLASTGAAAVLIGGRTFHSFFGLGVMQGPVENIVETASENRNVRYRIKKADTVIIDEISMLSGPTLAAAEKIARKIRKKDLPWGGLRVIAVGDFAQLPPVSGGGVRSWTFADPVWELSRFEPVVLQTMVRTEDRKFVSFLNQVREGALTDELAAFLDSRKAVPADFDGTRVFPRRETTERYNLERLAELRGEATVIPTEYTGSETNVELLKRHAPVPEALRLKLGALVMIRVNDPLHRYVNGSVGRVVFMDADRVEVELGRKRVEFAKAVFSYLDGDGKPKATAKNFPLTLAWASTIHKAQGATLPKILVDLQGLWEPGQAYVALSRTRSMEDLYILRWSPRSIQSDPCVTEFYRRGCPYDFGSAVEYSQA